MSAGYPYPIVPPLPDQERRTEITQPVTSRTESERKLTPEQEALQEEQRKLLFDQELVAGEKGQQKNTLAAAQSDLAQQQADQAAALEKQKTAAIAASQQSIDEHRARVQSTQARLDATPAPKFFQEGDTWHNALRGVGAAVAGVGDAIATGAAIRAGHAPQNIDTVSQIIERDLNRQRERIGMLKDQVVMARTGLTDANEARRQMLADIDLKGASAYDRLAKFGAARMAALGKAQPQIDQHEAILGLREKALENQAKALAPLHQTIEKHVEGLKRQVSETDRDPTKANAAKAKADENIVRDDESGKPLGHVASGRGGAQAFATRDADYARAIDQLKALEADVAGNGTRVLSPEAMKRRASLYHNAVIGVATVSPLGQTNEAMEQEAGSLGASGTGTGIIAGANPEAIARKIREMEAQRERYRKSTLTPIQPASPPAAAAPPSPPTEPPPFQAEGAATPPPAAPAASSPPVRTPARPPAAAPQSPAKLPDKLSGNWPPTRHTQDQIASITALLKSPDAKKPENRAKVKALIERLRDLRERKD